MQGVIADIITHANFIVNRLRGFGVLTPEILLSVGLAGRSYNSVSTAVIQCDNLSYTAHRHKLDKPIPNAFLPLSVYSCLYSKI